MVERNPRWPIAALQEAVSQALSAVGYEGPSNKQIRSIPDRRTIRYYTTLGLIDRPAEMRGRTALYGKRHLLQLVAIKRLQAEGLTLDAIQERMAGTTNTVLERLAQLPDDLAIEVKSEEKKKETKRRDRAFWSSTPARVAVPEKTEQPIAGDPQPGIGRGTLRSPTATLEHADLLSGVVIDDDVTLLFAAGRPVDEEDLRAIRNAAAPLLRLLTTRGLLPAER